MVWQVQKPFRTLLLLQRDFVPERTRLGLRESVVGVIRSRKDIRGLEGRCHCFPYLSDRGTAGFSCHLHVSLARSATIINAISFRKGPIRGRKIGEGLEADDRCWHLLPEKMMSVLGSGMRMVWDVGRAARIGLEVEGYSLVSLIYVAMIWQLTRVSPCAIMRPASWHRSSCFWLGYLDEPMRVKADIALRREECCPPPFPDNAAVFTIRPVEGDGE